MEVITAHATKNLCYIDARTMVPKGIVVHSTGANNPTLKRYVDCPEEVGENRYNNHWNQEKPGGAEVCVHAFIGYDKNNQVRVAEILPLNICCWGVGKGKKGSYNYDPAYIQFEICEDGLTDKSYYQKAFGVAAEYAAYLCGKFNIPIEAIVGHCEAYEQGYGSNHSDPEHWMKNFGETMDDFRRATSVFMKSKVADKTTAASAAKGEAKAAPAIADGDLVSIAANAVYYNGKPIPSWVKAQNWYVKGKPSGDRVVIDKNEKRTHAICSPVQAKFLTVVRQAETTDTTQIETAKSRCPYLVKVVVPSLDIHKAAGTNSAKTGRITDKGVYTITEEKAGVGASLWGKLKSGAGWISLDRVKKI